MSKSLFLFLFIFILPNWATATDNTKCLGEHPQKRTVYRDADGVVACVNYGGKKAVEYSYNKIKGFALGKQKYAEGALIGKRFYGFEQSPAGEMQLPNSEKFHATVLKDLFNEINQVTTLDQLIQKEFPNQKKQNEFIASIAQEYFQSFGKEVSPEFGEKTLIEKLNYIQNEMNLETPKTTEDLGLLDLTDEETMKLRVHLFTADRQKMSISQCNPSIVNSYQKVFSDNMISKKTMQNPRLFAETNIYQDQIKMVMGTFFLDNLLEKTIHETIAIMKDVPMDESNETVMLRYNRDGGNEHDFPDLPVLSRVMVHELGHIHQFSMLRQNNSPYQLYKIYINLASRLAQKDRFNTVPTKFKDKIKSEILEAVMGVFEYSAESYFVDAVPCIL